jgi:two-component system phosphate regulon response regulator PhoB
VASLERRPVAGSTAKLDAARRGLIVIVEDDETLRELTVEHLESVGFEVVAVANGDAGLEVVRARHPDLLCIDLNLPSVSGFDLCEHIRADPSLNDVTILMMSASVQLEARAFSFEAGADGYLRKPYSLDQLTVEINRLLNGATSTRRR